MEDAGLRFAYHNHNFEFNLKMESGETLYDYLIANCPNWQMIFDTYWVQYAGYDVCEYLRKVGGERLVNVHFKDMANSRKRSIVACDETGINMAIHPDDPPWDMFGLPRIITGMESYKKLFDAVPNSHNGITLCTGSLGAARENDLVKMASLLAKRSYFAHLRQIKFSGEKDFCECGHRTDAGSLDM